MLHRSLYTLMKCEIKLIFEKQKKSYFYNLKKKCFVFVVRFCSLVKMRLLARGRCPTTVYERDFALRALIQGKIID